MKVPSIVMPVVSVDRSDGRPLHRQIYDGFRAAILRGELRGGQQVPSTRLLAHELGISRIPAISAYEELLSEGYFESRAGAGTFVSRSLPENLTACAAGSVRTQPMRAAVRHTSKRGLSIPSMAQSPFRLGRGAFSVGQLAFDQFPLQVWSKIAARHARNLGAVSLQYGPTPGREDLREALAAYLRSARAVQCEPEQIIVVSGSQQALHIAALALLDPGDRVWMEEPGYWLAQQAFALAGCRIVPVPVDDEGLNVKAGLKLARRAQAAFVTPSHQFPLGPTMSLSRRLQLLDWAQSTGAWIIEDDYDSEFRYESRPIASLQGLDPDARVIYVGTFSKVLFPSVRAGYMVVPRDLVERFLTIRQTIDVSPSDFNQSVLAEFIEAGHFARHIRRMRVLYGERQATLSKSIRDAFDGELELLRDRSGMHLCVLLRGNLRDREIAHRALAHRLWLWPLSPAYIGTKPRHGFMLGFGGVSAQEIPRSVQLFRTILRMR